MPSVFRRLSIYSMLSKYTTWVYKADRLEIVHKYAKTYFEVLGINFKVNPMIIKIIVTFLVFFPRLRCSFKKSTDWFGVPSVQKTLLKFVLVSANTLGKIFPNLSF